MRLGPGAHLGPYEIVAPIGAGGMGEVYRARDSRLGREVAIKLVGEHASAYAIGVIYAGLGDRERAIASLETAYRERSHWLLWLKRDPRWDDLRTDPRFLTLVRKIGLPQ